MKLLNSSKFILLLSCFIPFLAFGKPQNLLKQAIHVSVQLHARLTHLIKNYTTNTIMGCYITTALPSTTHCFKP